MLKRTRDGVHWCLESVETIAGRGAHFVVIREQTPMAPAFQKVSFEMEKGGVVSLPNNEELKRVYIGIGGALRFGIKGPVDIDISAVFFSAAGKVLGAVDAECSSKY